MNKRYPTITLRISPEERRMIDELRDKYYISISKMFRENIKECYQKVVKGGVK